MFPSSTRQKKVVRVPQMYLRGDNRRQEQHDKFVGQWTGRSAGKGFVPGSTSECFGNGFGRVQCNKDYGSHKFVSVQICVLNIQLNPILNE